MRNKTLRRSLKALKWTLFSVLTLALLLVAVVLTVLVRPELILNDRNLERAASFARDRKLLDVRWKSGHISVESLALLHKRIKLEFDGLCVRVPSSGFDGCFDRAAVAAAGSFAGFTPKVTEAGPIDLRGGRITLKSVEGKEDEPTKDEKEEFKIPAFISGARVFPIRVEISRFELRDEKGEASMVANLDLRSKSEATGTARILADLGLRFGGGEGGKPTRVEADVDLNNPKGFWTIDTWKLAGRAKAELPDGSNARAELEAKAHSKVTELLFDYQLDGSYFRRGGLATVRANGIAGPDRVEAELNASARNLIPKISLAWTRGCKLEMARAATEVESGTVKTDCPIHFKVPIPPKGFPDLKVPTEAGIHLIANLTTGSYPPSPDSQVEGRVSVELDPILTPIFSGEGKLQSQLAGVPADFPTGWKMDTDLGVRIKVPKFQTLVKQLSNSPWDIWAPLRPLEGEVTLAVDGKFDATRGVAPIQFATRLSSSKQALNVDGKGQFQLERIQPSPKMHVGMEVVLTDIKLQLPPLPKLPKPGTPSLDPLPRYFPDSRFHRPISSFKKDPNQMLSYDLKIRTPEESPAEFTTPLVKKPIPVSVNLALSDRAPVGGDVHVLGFPVELFKREVELDHFNIALRNPSGESEIDGLLSVDYTDYTISILLLGTTAKPQVRFMSDPPLPEDQIVAVLLFGQKLDALDPDQTGSVGQTNAALREGALSLFSLYYLSSLNIQRIDYDPKTKNARLSFSLGEGTSLNLSEGGGEDSVGIRRRLTKHWAITTQLDNPADPTDRTATALLEWAYQY